MEVMDITKNGTENWLSTDYPDMDDSSIEEKDIFLMKVFIVLGILAIVMMLLIILAIRKRRLDQLRHRLMPFYKFEQGEEDEWQAELLEENEAQTFTRLQDYRSTHSVTSVYHDEKCF